MNFGKFWKCGFYDWRLIMINGEGKLRPLQLTKPPVTHSFPIKRIISSLSAEVDYVDEDPYDVLMA